MLRDKAHFSNSSVISHIVLDLWQRHTGNRRERKPLQSCCGPDVSQRGFNIVREFLMKLFTREQKWIKHCIIHAPDLILIKMKQGCELKMAVSPRNRSDSLLSPWPEGCVHSSELLLGQTRVVVALKYFYSQVWGQRLRVNGSHICITVGTVRIFWHRFIQIFKKYKIQSRMVHKYSVPLLCGTKFTKHSHVSEISCVYDTYVKLIP